MILNIGTLLAFVFVQLVVAQPHKFKAFYEFKKTIIITLLATQHVSSS